MAPRCPGCVSREPGQSWPRSGAWEKFFCGYTEPNTCPRWHKVGHFHPGDTAVLRAVRFSHPCHLLLAVPEVLPSISPLACCPLSTTQGPSLLLPFPAGKIPAHAKSSSELSPCVLAKQIFPETTSRIVFARFSTFIGGFPQMKHSTFPCFHSFQVLSPIPPS